MDEHDKVWAVIQIGSPEPMQAFEDRHKALRIAGNLAGNNSYSQAGDIHLFGPGDGSASVMVRQLPREFILKKDVPVTP